MSVYSEVKENETDEPLTEGVFDESYELQGKIEDLIAAERKHAAVKWGGLGLLVGFVLGAALTVLALAGVFK